jgi:hypothetical protein
MSPNVSPIMSTVSLIGSGATAAATIYMWLSRFRRERPNLQLYPAAAQTGVEVGVLRGDTRYLHMKVAAVVANCSALPNAVIDVALDLRTRDGRWEEVKSPRVTVGLPLNVSSLTTGLVTLEWTQPLPAHEPAEANNGPAAIIAGYLDHYYAQPAVARITVLALGDREFNGVVPLIQPR